jgi:hypothetical protein
MNRNIAAVRPLSAWPTRKDGSSTLPVDQAELR